MNKNDWKLLIVILILVFVLLLFYVITKKPSATATVYHANEVVLTIDLEKDANYTVMGDLGEVVIEVKNKQIRVEKETSPYHLCSKQGFVSASNESIICLPNRIIIEMNSQELDTQVK